MLSDYIVYGPASAVRRVWVNDQQWDNGTTPLYEVAYDSGTGVSGPLFVSNTSAISFMATDSHGTIMHVGATHCDNATYAFSSCLQDFNRTSLSSAHRITVNRLESWFYYCWLSDVDHAYAADGVSILPSGIIIAAFSAIHDPGLLCNSSDPDSYVVELSASSYALLRNQSLESRPTQVSATSINGTDCVFAAFEGPTFWGNTLDEFFEGGLLSLADLDSLLNPDDSNALTIRSFSVDTAGRVAILVTASPRVFTVPVSNNTIVTGFLEFGQFGLLRMNISQIVFYEQLPSQLRRVEYTPWQDLLLERQADPVASPVLAFSVFPCDTTSPCPGPCVNQTCVPAVPSPLCGS
jgi:hypothetical protein